MRRSLCAFFWLALQIQLCFSSAFNAIPATVIAEMCSNDFLHETMNDFTEISGFLNKLTKKYSEEQHSMAKEQYACGFRAMCDLLQDESSQDQDDKALEEAAGFLSVVALNACMMDTLQSMVSGLSSKPTESDTVCFGSFTAGIAAPLAIAEAKPADVRDLRSLRAHLWAEGDDSHGFVVLARLQEDFDSSLSEDLLRVLVTSLIACNDHASAGVAEIGSLEGSSRSGSEVERDLLRSSVI